MSLVASAPPHRTRQSRRGQQGVGANMEAMAGRDARSSSSSSSGSSNSSDSNSSNNSSRGASSEDEKHRKKHAKKKDKKHSKKKDKKEKKEKKHSKKKDKKKRKEKKEKKDKKRKRSSGDDDDEEDEGAHKSLKVDQGSFGKYGILREDSFHSKQREFDVYMEEVKGVVGVLSLPKRDVMQYYRGFLEDFNTATMPHPKFYNYAQWEMDEYRKEQANKQLGLLGSDGHERSAFNDEAEMLAERKRQRQAQEAATFAALKDQMARRQTQLEDMRRQEVLRAEQQLAFKVGDSQSVKRLERRLAPEEKTTAAKHPWAK